MFFSRRFKGFRKMAFFRWPILAIFRFLGPNLENSCKATVQSWRAPPKLKSRPGGGGAPQPKKTERSEPARKSSRHPRARFARTGPLKGGACSRNGHRVLQRAGREHNCGRRSLENARRQPSKCLLAHAILSRVPYQQVGVDDGEHAGRSKVVDPCPFKHSQANR